MTINKKKILLFLGSISLLFIAIILGFYNGYIRFNYPSSKKYPIQGIDISNHQKDIQWNLIDTTQIKFVYMKATEGGDFRDQRFSYNWKKAKERNIVIGAYHFFTFCKTGEEQAQNFIETVPKENGILPPVIDLEYGGNCKIKSSKEEILKEIKTIEELLFKHYKKKPIFYVTKEFYEDYLLNQFPNNPLWFRDIYGTPKIKGNRNWAFWQYANRGHLKGINTYVDLNVFNGSYPDFKKLLKEE